MLFLLLFGTAAAPALVKAEDYEDDSGPFAFSMA